MIYFYVFGIKLNIQIGNIIDKKDNYQFSESFKIMAVILPLTP